MLDHWTLDVSFIALWVLAFQWRRWHLKQAVEELSPEHRNLLGPSPYYLPPPKSRLPHGLVPFAKLHRSTRLPGVALFIAFVAIIAARLVIES